MRGWGSPIVATLAVTLVPAVTPASPAGPTPTSRAPASAPSLAPGDVKVACGSLSGDLPTCLAVVATAAGGLGVEAPGIEKITLVPWPAAELPEVTLAPLEGSEPVMVSATLKVFGVDFSYPGGALVVPVFAGADGWVEGLPPAASRGYSVAAPLAAWTEDPPFEAGSADYRLTVTCIGGDVAAAKVSVILQRLGDDEAPSEVTHLSCGGTATQDIVSRDVRLDAGQHRLRFVGSTAGLNVTLEPISADSSFVPAPGRVAPRR
jgi:hypothetical protein